jgi:hypothetical protein
MEMPPDRNDTQACHSACRVNSAALLQLFQLFSKLFVLLRVLLPSAPGYPRAIQHSAYIVVFVHEFLETALSSPLPLGILLHFIIMFKGVIEAPALRKTVTRVRLLGMKREVNSPRRGKCFINRHRRSLQSAAIHVSRPSPVKSALSCTCARFPCGQFPNKRQNLLDSSLFNCSRSRLVFGFSEEISGTAF